MEFLKPYSLYIEILGGLSALTFLGSLIVIPWIISKMPEDYFVRHRKLVEERHEKHPVAARFIFFIRNTSGVFFLFAGILMLFLPGQGIVTILIGICLTDFPRKHKIVDYLITRQRVTRILNWIRKKEKKKPFIF